MDYYGSDHSTKDFDTQVLMVLSVNNNILLCYFSMIINQTFSIIEDHIHTPLAENDSSNCTARNDKISSQA